MPEGYHQLTYEVDTLKKKGDALSSIAQAIGVDKSTVSRELRRNKGEQFVSH